MNNENSKNSKEIKENITVIPEHNENNDNDNHEIILDDNKIENIHSEENNENNENNDGNSNNSSGTSDFQDEKYHEALLDIVYLILNNKLNQFNFCYDFVKEKKYEKLDEMIHDPFLIKKLILNM